MVHALNPFEALALLDRLDREGRRPAVVDLERPDDPQDARALVELFAERHPGVRIRWRRAGRFSRRRPQQGEGP